MNKVFRFKYEPCNGMCYGMCYAWCDFLPEQLNKLTTHERITTISKMVDAHAKLCDNEQFSFGVDYDPSTEIFVAHFRTPDLTHTFASRTFKEIVEDVTSTVMKAEIPKVSGACSYGDSGAEDLGKEILRACVDNDFRQKHHDSCPCNK